MRLLQLSYSAKLPFWAKPEPNCPISFRYPGPIGELKLVLRDNSGADNFIFSEVFDHRYYDFKLSNSLQTILDLGANVGYTAVFFGRKYREAQIACVEPMPQNLESLRQNLALNGIQAVIFGAAVTVDDGIVQMETAVNDYGYKIADDKVAALGTSVSCQGVSIPTLIKQLGWRRISLLKIDIEGYERVLFRERYDWLNLVDAFCIEIHPGFSESTLKQLALEFGFEDPIRLPGIWLVHRECQS